MSPESSSIHSHQRETLAAGLRRIFGRADEGFVDAALPLLQWRELAGGETLMREGDPADGVSFVISGRLRAFVTNEDGEPRVIGEIARGETVGEMGILTGEPRTATVIAVRDTVLAHASRASFEKLLASHPELPIHMARILIERLKRTASRPEGRKPATVCVLPVTDDVDATGFAQLLRGELQRWCTTTIADRTHESLDELEARNDIVLLVANDGADWTRRCLRQADEVLLVAKAAAEPRVHPMEGDTRARRTLVLLHDASVAHPRGTARWLDRRPVDAHVHVRPALQRDVARLARIVSGNAIGMVLAGGGARGFAHLGVYKALEEAGIEIDFVGGTSMGAIIAAYLSLDHSADALIGFARKAFAKNPTGDVNLLPLLSLIKGQRIRSAATRAIVEATGSHDTDVADSWRTFYCVASNYSSAREMVLTRGRLDRAIRASLSIPVALPPVLWNGELLIDGAVFNNFPTDVMARLGAGRIIGVDLSRRNDRRYDFDELPSTWQLLLDRFRKRRRYKLPTLGALLMRTTILYSESRGDQARDSVDLYLNPDCRPIGLLDWKSFDRLVEIGYRHAKEVLATYSEEELAPYRNEAGMRMTA